MAAGRNLRVLVTGGAGALGRAVCRGFLATGAHVVAVSRSAPERLEKEHEPSDGRLDAVAGDLSDPTGARAAVELATERLGGLDVLCNAAGGFAMGPFATFAAEQMDRMLDVNFRTAYLCAQAALPHLIAEGRGKIVFVASRAALQSSAQMVAYAASKAAVLAMSRSLAAELMQYDIQVNAVLPSIIDTPENRAAMPDAEFGRWPKPDEIARVICWLCSEDAKLLSGAEIPVYGRA